MSLQRIAAATGFAVVQCSGCQNKFEVFASRFHDAQTLCFRCRTGSAPKRVAKAGAQQARNFSAWMAGRTERRIWIEGLLRQHGIPFGPPRRPGGDGTGPADWAREGRRRDRLNALLRDAADTGATDDQIVAGWKLLIASEESQWTSILLNVRNDSGKRINSFNE